MRLDYAITGLALALGAMVLLWQGARAERDTARAERDTARAEHKAAVDRAESAEDANAGWAATADLFRAQLGVCQAESSRVRQEGAAAVRAAQALAAQAQAERRAALARVQRAPAACHEALAALDAACPVGAY